MKKGVQKKKLQVHSSTVRILCGNDLQGIAGGLAGSECGTCGCPTESCFCESVVCPKDPPIILQ